MKVPVQSNQGKGNSSKSMAPELPKLTRVSCAHQDNILNEECEQIKTIECSVCDKCIIDQSLVCSQCNLNYHKECMEASGLGFICLNCRSTDNQIQQQAKSPKQNDSTNSSLHITQHSPISIKSPMTIKDNQCSQKY